jgi:ABC-type Fe3+/spermidine/putrescine transport system ATPase subunit
MAGIQLKGVSKQYGAVKVVHEINLDVAEGEFIVLLGPSGCGKTTTLRCIAGLENVSGGEILMDGKVISSAEISVPPEKREIGMVFQSYAIWPHMTVGENVAFGLKLKKLPKAEITTRVTAALELVGLGAVRDRSASQLSGGQQQRVALARATVLEPRILLFDEPLSNLDAKLRDRMRLELRELHKRLGITSIYVTHDQQEAMVIADRVVLMNAGHIDQIGTADDIYQRPNSRFGAEFIGLANIMSGRVTGGDANSTRVTLDAGFDLVAAVSRPTADQVDLFCRPENVVVSPTPIEGINVAKASVTAAYSLGNIADVFLRSGTLPIRVQISPPRPMPEGQELWVQFPPESLRLLPR